MLHTTTLTGTTRTGQGLTVEVTIDDLDPQVPGPMAVGATVVAGEFAQLTPVGRNAGAAFCRTFSEPGTGILPRTHPRRRLPAGAATAEFHSFKDWTSDTAATGLITGLLDDMPAALLDEAPLLPGLTAYDPDGYAPDSTAYDGFSMLLTWCHEGEKNMLEAGIPAREWRRRHRLAYKTVRQHRNGRRVGYMPIQTGTWTEAKSNLAKRVIKGDFDPIPWWAGVGDYAGYDAYVISETGKVASRSLYPAPAQFFEVPLQLAAASGRRLFLPELGVIRQGSGPGDLGQFRADWITDAIAYLASRGCAGVAWWDALGSNNRDFRLLDAPSQAAWQAAIAGQR